MKTIASKYHDIILNNQSIKNKQSIIQHLPASEKKQIQILKHRIRQDRWENVKLRVSIFFDTHLMTQITLIWIITAGVVGGLLWIVF